MTDTLTVPARDLDIGDRINGARVTRRDDLTTPGVVYVWIDDNDRVQARADMIFHHGDRVRITRDVAATCSNGCGQPATCGPLSFGAPSRCARHEHLPSDYD